MIARSVYNPRGVVHRWTCAVDRDWQDMMHSNCGLDERRTHLDTNVPERFPRCQKCFKQTPCTGEREMKCRECGSEKVMVPKEDATEWERTVARRFVAINPPYCMRCGSHDIDTFVHSGSKE